MIKKKTRWSSDEPVDPSSVFTTYDLGCASFLLCLGYKLVSLDRDNPRKALFVFRREPRIEEYANKYFTDEVEVKARSMFDSIKALKNKLYSE
jgi:hypothetical protein